MYECFEKYLGIEGCNEDEPVNGMYINGSKGLAGISLISASNIADEETKSGLSLLKGCRHNAIIDTISDAKIELSRYFEFNKILHKHYYNPTLYSRSGIFNYFIDNSSIYKYSKIEVSTITIVSKGVETITLTIEEDKNVRTLSVDLVVGNNVVTINSTANFRFELSITTSVEIIYDSESFFRGTILVRCDDELFWCAYASELALAMRYKTGYLYYNELISSTRLNTTIDRNTALTNMQMWYGVYNQNNGRFEGGEYQKYINSAVQTIKNSLINDNDACIVCNQIKHLYAKP